MMDKKEMDMAEDPVSEISEECEIDSLSLSEDQTSSVTENPFSPETTANTDSLADEPDEKNEAVNSESIQVEKTNFDQKKEQIKSFSNQKSLIPEFEPYKTNDGLFGWFDHAITGKEMNEFVQKLQQYISENNGYTKKIIKEFGQVYETFDVLDSEYIHGILLNIKATEKVSKENAETIQALQATVKKLKEIKEENDAYHQYIDSIGDDLDKLHAFAQEFDDCKNKIANLESRNKALNKMLYIAYAIAGSSLLVAIISMILMIIK